MIVCPKCKNELKCELYMNGLIYGNDFTEHTLPCNEADYITIHFIDEEFIDLLIENYLIRNDGIIYNFKNDYLIFNSGKKINNYNEAYEVLQKYLDNIIFS